MIVHLQPRAPFTKGAPRSDTLYGAISWAIRLLYGEEALIRLLEETEAAVSNRTAPPLVISSLFPSLRDREGRLLLLPRPLMPPAVTGSLDSLEDYQESKRLRRANLVSRSVFDAIAAGELDETALHSEFARRDAGRFRLVSNAIVTSAEAERLRPLTRLVVNGETARNTINRLSVSTADGGQLFYQPITSTRSLAKLGIESGFYFIARAGGERAGEVSAMVKAAMHFLGEKGLGGDTTVGRGHCEVEIDDNDDVTGAADGSRLVTLSLLHPSADDLAHFAERQRSILVKLEKRKGFIESAYTSEVRRIWKPTLFMFGEGSTFPRDGARPVYGQLYTDRSQREGLSFSARINGLACTAAMRESG